LRTGFFGKFFPSGLQWSEPILPAVLARSVGTDNPYSPQFQSEVFSVACQAVLASGNLAAAMIRWNLIIPLGTLVFAAACSTNLSRNPSALPATTNLQTFEVKGVIVEMKDDGKTVCIRHEEIPGYMEAMTMPFEARPTNELAGLSVGDTVVFRMSVTDTDGWIDEIRKLGLPKVAPPALPTGISVVPDVEPLSVGDLLPDYRFTNQLGQTVSLSEFRGQALGITFIFTRCPFPTFCPQMSRFFQQAQDKLLATPNAPTNWHLLTISFDPSFDTPERLRDYAAQYRADLNHWSFLTGSLVDVTTFTEQFGLTFWRETSGGTINHNLRTVVVDAAGRVQKNIPENKWTSDELAEAILKGCTATDQSK